jgi:hypothetical protein
MPQEWGLPLQEGSEEAEPLTVEANVENFLASLVEPQRGHLVPVQSLERTRISLSLSHFAQ